MKKVGLFLAGEPHGGGTYQYNQMIIDAVASLPEDRFKVVIVYTHQLWNDYLKSYSIEVILASIGLAGRALSKLWRLSGLPIGLLRTISHYTYPVSKILADQRCDIWIFPSQDSISYQVKVPALTSIHDLMHRYERSFPEVSSKYEYISREKHYKNICKWSKGILVDSDVGKNQVHESYKTPLNKIFILPFVAPRYLCENKKIISFVKNYNLPKKFIFYPAQFWEHKNHMRLVKAIYILKEKLPDINLVLVGSPKNGYKKTRELVEELRMQKIVHFMGYVPDEDIPVFYKLARAMVMPTFFGPTNIPPLEAFVVGCPVAISGIYGMPEQVGDAALLFNPESVEEIADCIKRLWVDDNLCEELKIKGKKRSASWGQAHFNKRLLKIIDKLI